MCKPKTYKRFSKIYEYIDKNSKHGDMVFNTKLGPRLVTSGKWPNKTIDLAYLDCDSTVLFDLLIYPSGKIEINQSKIDKVAIFSAIYEIECIIHNKKQSKDNSKVLERLFENIDEFSFQANIFGNFAQRR